MEPLVEYLQVRVREGLGGLLLEDFLEVEQEQQVLHMV